MDETLSANQKEAWVALAGQTGGAIRVVLEFLFLFVQAKRKGQKHGGDCGRAVRVVLEVLRKPKDVTLFSGKKKRQKLYSDSGTRQNNLLLLNPC